MTTAPEFIRLSDGTTIRLLILPTDLGMSCFAVGEMSSASGQALMVAALNVEQVAFIRLFVELDRQVAEQNRQKLN